MKLLLKLSLAPIFVILLFSTLFVALQKGYLNNQIKTAIVHYLKYKQINIDIKDLKVANGTLKIDEALINLSTDNQIKITDLDIKFSARTLLRTGTINAKLRDAKIELPDQMFTTNLVGDLNFSPFGRFKGYKVETQHRHPELDSGSKLPMNEILNQVQDDTGSDSQFTGSIAMNDDGQIAAALKITNTPLSFFKLLTKFLPENEAVKYCNDNITAGVITEGEIKLNLDREFFEKRNLSENNIKGNLKIIGLKLEYDPDFPPLDKTDATLTMSGSNLNCVLGQAYIADTPIANGLIIIDYSDLDKVVMSVTGSATGDAKDLINFIPQSKLIELKNQNIDLTKITGKTITNINIQVPFDMSIKNTYNITTKSDNIGLRIFEGNMILTGARMEGTFNGDFIKIAGAGKINDFASDLNLIYEDKKDALNLKIQTNIVGKNQKFDLLKLVSGKAQLNFEYSQQGKANEVITLTSDLRNLEFFIDKIFIYKPAPQRARLEFSNKPDYPNYNINLTGDNNLKITGTVASNKTGYNLNFSSLNQNQTKLKAKINYIKNKAFNAVLTGGTLDLTNADMFQFLEKEEDSIDADISVNIAQVMLKNNIFLSPVNFQIKCANNKCYKGYLDSKIGDKSFNMLLTPTEYGEQWTITSSDAGSILKGIGMYRNMKGGALALQINPNRNLVNKGQIVPIVDGHFTLNNFVIVNNPFITRLVSFTSLPGIASAITNNKDIAFNKMSGQFNYTSNKLNIHHNLLEGPYMSLTMDGDIDTNNRTIKLTGYITPSLYGINSFVKNIPIIGNILSGKNRKGVISMPYSIKDRY
jgi:Protein of unknown function/AsmA-like C-terminal region